MSKPAEIVQKGNKSPSEFYEKLCEACRLYTPIDPEATGSQIVINSTFTPQACPDIKRKLQKTEGVLSMSSSQLVEIANKVFRTRDMETEKKMKKGIKTSRGEQREVFNVGCCAWKDFRRLFHRQRKETPPSFEVRTALQPVPMEASGSITAKSMRLMPWV